MLYTAVYYLRSVMRVLGFFVFSVLFSCADELSADTQTVVTETGSSTSTTATTQETAQSTETSSTTSTDPNIAPIVAILLPSAAGEYGATQQIDFLGEIFDDIDLLESMPIVWESDLDGLLKMDITYGDKGLVTGRSTLSEGVHMLSLTATDSGGLTGRAEVSINVNSNEVPTCEITDPVTGTVIPSNSAAIAFFGYVTDEETAATDLSVEWSSNIDGLLFTGTAEASGETAVKLKTMTLGAHTITLEATDGSGSSCTDAIEVTFGQSPAVSIDKPSTGEVFLYGTEVQFQVLGKDYEDLPETLSLAWESSINGLFSTASLDAAGEVEIFISTLSVGAHDVTITATDSDGMTGSDAVTIEIL
jgi:hypothetical protein